MAKLSEWDRFKAYNYFEKRLGFSLDYSRMHFPEGFFAHQKGIIERALREMQELEGGAIANPTEKRMVGHYWLRKAELAPAPELSIEIKETLERIKKFAAAIHQGEITAPTGEKFRHLLVVGIGGSALGPQFVSQALRSSRDPLNLYFFDNTDPDGMERTLAAIPDLSKTICVVISKSGGTKETRNGQLVAKAAWQKSGLDFAKAFVAVTGVGSELDKTAQSEGWLERFPMWDWVGGRTSLWSAVGLLPAALQGFNIDLLLSGGAAMDELTRSKTVTDNPALLLALMWYAAGKGRGEKEMVVLPYKDRLELFSKYLQQLVMESLGKRLDLEGKEVYQGLTVFGNKGSTDQHAYIQQLRDGLSNFFVVFIEVLKDKVAAAAREPGLEGFSAAGLEVEPAVVPGDYLSGFFLGTREALYESGRSSMTITIDDLEESSLGMLIALFERAVGFYASLIHVNAYDQPGVEAGKKAAANVLKIQGEILAALGAKQTPLSIEDIAEAIGLSNRVETVFKIVRHLAANGRVQVKQGGEVWEDTYRLD